MREAANNIQRGGGSLNLAAFRHKVLPPLDFRQSLCIPLKMTLDSLDPPKYNKKFFVTLPKIGRKTPQDALF